ncbi:MAG: AAA family ATPase [Clostridia bacterium]|nr:AAA family ATPase [Clostridia bacterium]MBQ8235672.1 AAA family ATPase [Clostridia bacterium]
MQKTFVIILGPHAVGKMTVGQELATITGLRLFHNHMSIELARKLLAPNETEEFQTLNRAIRQNVFELFAIRNLPGLIFTYMCPFDQQEELDYLMGLIRLFSSNKAKCCVVELCADFDVRLLRNKSENRLLHKESKRNLLWSEAEMRETSQKYRLNSYDGEKLPFENYMKIDNTNLPPDEVARMIKAHFAIGE